MPRLNSVELKYGSSIEVRFTTTSALALAADTAVLQLTDGASSGSELGIRIERGRVVDFYIWDAGRRLRQRMPADEVVIDGRHVSCVIPMSLVPVMRGVPRPLASLVVNGAPVQSRFAVRMATHVAAAPVERELDLV